jgi:hypothetical protein
MLAHMAVFSAIFDLQSASIPLSCVYQHPFQAVGDYHDDIGQIR